MAARDEKVTTLLDEIKTTLETAITEEVTIAIEADASIPAIGAVGDAAWVSGNGTLVAILKAIHAQLVIIAANTEPAP